MTQQELYNIEENLVSIRQIEMRVDILEKYYEHVENLGQNYEIKIDDGCWITLRRENTKKEYLPGGGIFINIDEIPFYDIANKLKEIIKNELNVKKELLEKLTIKELAEKIIFPDKRMDIY